MRIRTPNEESDRKFDSVQLVASLNNPGSGILVPNGERSSARPVEHSDDAVVDVKVLDAIVVVFEVIILVDGGIPEELLERTSPARIVN